MKYFLKFRKFKNFFIAIKRYFIRYKESRVLIGFTSLILLGLLLSILTPYFFTVSNILNVLRQISIIAVLSIGMTYVIITGGIDLSVGSVLALSAVVTALFIKQGLNIYLAIIVGLIVGAVCGYISGTLITSRSNMPPFIATLAMMGITRGLSMVATGGIPIYGLPQQFKFIGGGYVVGIPVPVVIMILLYIIGYINLSYTKGGIYYYAVGGNQEAARVAGINIRKVKLGAYIISGMTAAIGGVILASRLGSIEPLSGQGYELDAIAAAVIGGANLYGGEGSLFGTLIGAMVMGIIRNGLTLLDVSPYWQQVAVGVVIAGVVSISVFKKK